MSLTISSKTSSSLPTATPTLTPTIKPEVSGNWTYLGCQTEATNSRALAGASYFNTESMDLEYCGASCAGWKYFGVEYGRECYCGNSFGAGSATVIATQCSFLCPGDSTEFCGAGNRLSIYVTK